MKSKQQNKPNGELTAKLDKYVKDCVFYYDLPGIVIGAGICECDYKYEGAGGFGNAATKEPLQTDSVFHMTSITKLFTSTAILMLLESKKLSLDDKMVDILPDAPIVDKRYSEVTIKHILTHTSGIFKSKFLYPPSDKHFVYEDLEYDTLGTVIEIFSGMRYDEYVKEKILVPLCMHDTEISVGRESKSVFGHSKNEEKQFAVLPRFQYERTRMPSSSLTSTVHDMGKWAAEVLSGRTLLKPETYEFALQEYAKTPEKNQHICMSWFKRKQAGYALYGHIGADIGYKSGFWICPELNLHFTVLTNITTSPINKICDEVFDILLHYLRPTL